VQNAAAMHIFDLCCTDPLTEALICLHWPSVLERVQFKLHGCAHISSASWQCDVIYLCTFTSVSSLPGRYRLRSADSLQLVVPFTSLSTIGDRTFPVADALVWKSLPAYVTSYHALSIFRACFITHFFSISFPGVVLHCC
jgi:hypothetical protein